MNNGLIRKGAFHRLVEGGGKYNCDKCSLYDTCQALSLNATVCITIMDGRWGDYFVKEEE